jgi:hypothetical protein
MFGNDNEDNRRQLRKSEPTDDRLHARRGERHGEDDGDEDPRIIEARRLTGPRRATAFSSPPHHG